MWRNLRKNGVGRTTLVSQVLLSNTTNHKNMIPRSLNFRPWQAILVGMVGILIVQGMASGKDSESPSSDSATLVAPQIPAIGREMQKFIDQQEIAGVVTLVANHRDVVHFGVQGKADLKTGEPMQPDSLFWIASMTKPVTATAIMMLHEEGKLSVEDPVTKYIPELAQLKTKDGKPVTITLRHLLTHTSGMGEVKREEGKKAKNLAELIPLFASKPVQFEPGSQWMYSQSGINTLGRIVEVVSGKSFPDFLQERLFTPLEMKDTTFYPTESQIARLAKTYKRENQKLIESSIWIEFAPQQTPRYPAANGGLFSTASDYLHFCQMILNQGTWHGRRYLKPESVRMMTQAQTGNLKTGFTEGNAWGLGWCVIEKPENVTGMLSPGTFGHGGAFGTQAWIDSKTDRIYLLMVQRENFPNSDASDVRKAFQTAAASTLEKP